MIATAHREDDQYLLMQVLGQLDVKNKIHFFSNGQQMLDYLALTQEQPFLIFCDMNMPLMNGLELRRHIYANPELKKKAIPIQWGSILPGASI